MSPPDRSSNSTAEVPSSLSLGSFGGAANVAVVGASGGLGRAFVELLADCTDIDRIAVLSRSNAAFDSPKIQQIPIDLASEDSIARAADDAARYAGPLHIVIVASGILHDGDRLQPEKTWRALSGPSLETAFRLNAIGPALVAKHFLPLLATDGKSVFAAISARVGSIGDNRLGGWYAYRASKAALNMLIKTLSIELARRNGKALCVGLHPGTVDTALSKPFQAGVPTDKLFSPAQSARYLLTVLDRLTPADSGHLYAWNGERITF